MSTQTVASNAQSAIHPSFRARLVRALRLFRSFPGWYRFLQVAVPIQERGRFRVCNASGWFEGDIDNHIERALYFDGGYEPDMIDAFLGLFQDRPHRVILDIGANIGTHSIAFAKLFDTVCAFEPNPPVFQKLLNNLRLNPSANVAPQPVGLAAKAGILPFYNIENGNAGLGTFLSVEQYDKPLEETGKLEVCRGDDVVPTLTDDPIDAIKIDIQGFEPDALLGLQSVLKKHKPVIWLEVGQGTQEHVASGDEIVKLIPYPVKILAFQSGRRNGLNALWLEPLASLDGFVGNIVMLPAQT